MRYETQVERAERSARYTSAGIYGLSSAIALLFCALELQRLSSTPSFGIIYLIMLMGAMGLLALVAAIKAAFNL